MTQISTIYDAIDTLIQTQLTTYTRIPNPYDPPENASLLLRRGYGIGVADGANTERQVGCSLSIARIFQILLINQITTTDHNMSARETIEKNLMEDQYKIVKAFEQNPSLSASTMKVKYISDTGLEFLETDDQKYFIVTTAFEAEYLETI